jgi:hypothetical protein
LLSRRHLRVLATSLLPCIVIKALSESHKISRLMTYFSHSSAIWVFRHYDQVIASNMARWPGGTNKLHEIVEAREHGEWRTAGMTDETYQNIRNYYRPDLSVASSQALFWYYRNQLFYDQQFEDDPRVLLMRYETITENPVCESKKLADFLGIRLSHRAVRHVFSESAKRRLDLDVEPRIRALCEEMLARLIRSLEIKNRSAIA